jgi:dTDP-4-dehydrorhamnose 3,5-epimerase
VLRGIHFADVPPGQAKYVTCVAGSIIDVIVDLRVGADSFGAWEAITLDDARRQAVYLPEGMGHAFVATSQQATVVYMCSEVYNPAAEHTVDPFDSELAIDWADLLGSDDFTTSERDGRAPSLAAARTDRLLPDYEDCRALYGRLAEGR